MDTFTKKTENKKNRVLIACSMVEDELNQVLTETSFDGAIIWMDRGLHNTPERLKEALQDEINRHSSADEILLTFGLCGNGTDGICSQTSTLIIPRFDDCLNMLLCTGKRCRRGLTRPDSIYMTAGWTKDREAILGQYETLKEKYDEETCEIILETMYEHYQSISVIDTGAYELPPVLSYAEKAAELLDLNVGTVSGTVRILQQLVTGDWDENFIILPPMKTLCFDHFSYPDKEDGGDKASPIQ